jgi:RimJ/RimL family protein N-acetyltransferase
VLKLEYPLRTDRLELRPFAVDDLDDAYRYMSDPAIVRYLYWQVRDRAEVRAFLAERALQGTLEREGDRLYLAIVLPLTGQVIGEIMLHWTSREHQQGEIGFVLSPDFHGKGYAREAALVALEVGFDLLGLHRIVGRCDANNVASASLMERLAMRREAHFIHDEFFKGDWSDTLVYAMLDDEWKVLRSGEGPGLSG